MGDLCSLVYVGCVMEGEGREEGLCVGRGRCGYERGSVLGRESEGDNNEMNDGEGGG